MDTKILKEIGLSSEEIKVYLTLLKSKEITATKVSTETGIPRTNTYRIIDNLITKGLASHILKNNIKYFSATNPRIILEDHKRKEKDLKKILPELEKFRKEKDSEFQADVFKGKEGLIAVLRSILREKKDYVVLGEEGNLQEILPDFMRQILRDTVHFNIKERILSKISLKGKIKANKNSNIKYLPDEYFSPTMTVVFGDNTAIFDWNKPYHAVVIKSKNTAQSFKSYFELLWKQAKP